MKIKTTKSVLVLLFTLLVSANSWLQTTVNLQFQHMNNNQTFQLDETITALNGVEYSVQNLAYYISRVVLIHDGGQELKLDTSTVFVIKHESPMGYLGSYPISIIEGIKFVVGVPEYLNHLDISTYPEHHPLSFQSPQMHWGWSSGYMHMILNALGDNNNDGTPTEGFQLHCLGDNNIQDVNVATTANIVSPTEQLITINTNLDQWITSIDPATVGIHHGSDGLNAQAMQNVTDYPVFTSPLNAVISEVQLQQPQVVQLENETQFIWSPSIKITQYELLNAEGRRIATGSILNNKLSVANTTSGLMLLNYSTSNNQRGIVKWVAP